MKYAYGDIVCQKKCGPFDSPFPLQVISFDDKKNKYLCLDTTEYSPGDFGTCLYLLAAADLVSFSSIDPEYSEEIKSIYNKLFPSDLDTAYFDIYEVEEGKISLVRKAFRPRKEFEIPVLNKKAFK